MDRYAKYGNHNDKDDAEFEETKDAVGIILPTMRPSG